MTKQQQTVLHLAIQHEKGFIGHLAKAIPIDQMEPAVKALYTKKVEVVAALEKRVRG